MPNTDLPDGWHWGCGEISGGSKTYWFYSNLRYHYQGELYTDPNQPWTVNFYEETGKRDGGDVRVAEYPTRSKQFDNESDALQWLYEQATELLPDACV